MHYSTQLSVDEIVLRRVSHISVSRLLILKPNVPRNVCPRWLAGGKVNAQRPLREELR